MSTNNSENTPKVYPYETAIADMKDHHKNMIRAQWRSTIDLQQAVKELTARIKKLEG